MHINRDQNLFIISCTDCEKKLNSANKWEHEFSKIEVTKYLFSVILIFIWYQWCVSLNRNEKIVPHLNKNLFIRHNEKTIYLIQIKWQWICSRNFSENRSTYLDFIEIWILKLHYIRSKSFGKSSNFKYYLISIVVGLLEKLSSIVIRIKFILLSLC